MAQQRPRSLAPVIVGATAVVAGAVSALSLFAKKNNFQPPTFLLRYLLTKHSQVGPLFPLRRIRRADHPREFPANLTPVERVVSWRGSYQGLTRVLRETETNTFLVAKDGVLVHEWCRPGFTPATRQSSWSVGKSVVGLLTGKLIHEGFITEETLLTEVLPEYRTGGPFDTITVGHLLDMRAGIDLPEEYVEWKAYTGVGGMMTTRDLPRYLSRSRNIFAEPGTVSDYRSVDTQFLSMVLTRVTGTSLSQLVHEYLWNPMGALDDATWTLDHEAGIEKGFMGLNASARDYLKIGQLVLDRGKVDEEQVIPETWIDRISTPAGLVVGEHHTWGYGATWWHPTGHEEHEDMTALGVYGQYVYVNWKHGVVIAKHSDYGTEQDEDELIAVFREIATSL